MDKRDKVIATLIVLIVLTIAALQFGMYVGRTANAEATVRTPEQATIDLLKQQLAEARLNAEVEKEKLSIILCESDYNRNNGTIRHTAWGDGGKSYGVAQFQFRTFNDLRTQAGRPDLRWKNRDDQIWLLDWALRHGYGKYWTCYSRRGES
ncbi:MAG: hypothetical protein AABZ15_11660 [Nitrospirota bacterium]